jgi:hypothetical protein
MSESVPSDLCCMITDNGSYRPESTLSLRKLASTLSERIGHPVHPVSLLHSTKIDPAALGGEPAQIFEPFIKEQMRGGTHRFLMLPLFFGPSAAINEYVPQRVLELQSENFPGLEMRVAPCVVDRRNEADTRMARILLDLASEAADGQALKHPALAIVDHGTPRQAVTEVRNLLARQVAGLAGDRFSTVAPCSMERREGAEYAFNEPLLEKLLGTPGFEKEVVVGMLFASPGRHAGPGGDVAAICAEATKHHPELRAFMTELVATHPGLIDLLVERFHQGLHSDPVIGEIPA